TARTRSEAHCNPKILRYCSATPMPAGAPQKRSTNLIIERLPEETLIYDLVRNRAHCLGRGAALLWHSCDGRRSPDQLARMLVSKLGMEADPALVDAALERLSQRHLLTRSWKKGRPGTASRRRVLKGLAAAMAVTTVVAPLAAQAGSCIKTC